jgi:hypothetical protein
LALHKQNILNLIISFFKSELKKGAFENPYDIRDLQYADLVKSTKSPDTFSVDISKLSVNNQLGNGSCVGQAVSKYIEAIEPSELSARFVYAMAKKLDNLTFEGTYPWCAAKVVKDTGILDDTEIDDRNALSHSEYINVNPTGEDLKKAGTRKISAYAYVHPGNPELIKNAISKNKGMVGMIKGGDYDFSTGQVTINGRTDGHYVYFYGYETVKNIGGVPRLKLHFLNSWGIDFGNQGRGWVWYDNVNNGNLIDCMVFTKAPKKTIEDNKEKWRWQNFLPTEKGVKGLKPELLDKMQAIRNTVGFALPVSSGYRTPEHNASIGGVKNSSHTLGLGVDFSMQSGAFKIELDKLYKKGLRGKSIFSETKKLIKLYKKDKQAIFINACLKHGVTRIGIYDRHVHIDIDTTKPNPAIWTGKSE